jgi:large subunit ribosomal protein L31e
LDTNEDKGLEEKQAKEDTEETKESEEATELEEGEEGETEDAGEKQVEEATPTEEVGEAKKVEGVAEEAEEEKEAEETVPEAEEEEKKEKRKKEAEEEEIVEERIYTIPLRRVWISPRKKRAPRAVRIVEGFIQRHMKVETGTKAGEEEEEARLIISNEVNEKLWSRGIEKPPRNIRVRAVKDKEGTVTVYLAEGD